MLPTALTALLIKITGQCRSPVHGKISAAGMAWLTSQALQLFEKLNKSQLKSYYLYRAAAEFLLQDSIWRDDLDAGDLVAGYE